MNRRQFFDITAYQYQIKALEREVEAFRSEQKYVRMEEEHRKQLRSQEKVIHDLKRELSKAHAETISVRNVWSDIMDDLDKEHSCEMQRKERQIKELKCRILEVERQRDRAKDLLYEKQLELQKVLLQLEEASGMIKKLTIQVNRDFENSSIPSSLQGPRRKKIPNTRETTGKKQGAQSGHKGHGRKKQEPTKTVLLPQPEITKGNPDYYKTGSTKRKQVVGINVCLTVTEYVAEEYRNKKTGSRMYAPFPAGAVDDVNYDGSVKAFLCMLNTECNVSIDKTSKFLKELTGGKLEISKGMIGRLIREFSKKTEQERKNIISNLMASSVMHADFTNANVDGKGCQVLVVSDPAGIHSLYLSREKKGHEGIKGSPVENYVGTLVHDHDKSFYRYGQRHQECMQHNLRYLKGSMENEPERKWNKDMHDLLQRMLHYKNSLEGSVPDPVKTNALETEYDEILALAEKEYTQDPPNNYYREGYNLYRRLKEYRESELLFLKEADVPSNNSVCERLARVYKRKQKQAIVLRSLESFEALCNSLSVLHLLRAQDEENVMDQVAEAFNRHLPEKQEGNRFKKPVEKLQG